MMTRFRLKHQLLAQQIDATDEPTDEDTFFSVKGVANCGLVITSPSCLLRILKWRNGELPPSASKERSEFYQGNLFAFEPNDPFPDRPIPPLNLVVAWETNADHELQSFSVVCPWGESGNRVQNKWWRTLHLPMDLQPKPSPSVDALPPEPSLDEITRKSRRSDFESKPLHGSDDTDAKTDDAS
jgi:hypothetical protein